MMTIQSSAFTHNGTIPKRYTCDGEDINPPLSIAHVPSEAKSLTLIVDDPDAPGGDFVHWLVWNIDPKETEIGEGAIPAGTVEGMTGWNRIGWGGPCPPEGEHRYQFKLYALDTTLPLSVSANKAELLAAIDGHVIAEAVLTGRYQR